MPPFSAGRRLVCGTRFRRTGAHSDGLRALVWSTTTIVTGGGGVGFFFSLVLPSAFVLGMGEGATLAGGGRARVFSKLDLARVARHGGWPSPMPPGVSARDPRRPIVALPDRLVLLAFFHSSLSASFGSLGGALWWWYFHEDPCRHPGITAAELAALPTADPARQIASGPVPWRRLVPPRGAVDDHLLLPGLDRLALCDPGCRPCSRKNYGLEIQEGRPSLYACGAFSVE